MKIILSVALAILLIACSDDTSSSSAKKEEILKQVNATSKTEQALVEDVPETVVKDEVKTAVIAAEDTTVEVVEELSKKSELPVVQAVASKSGADLYKACSSCHGQNAEKKALNKSQIIQGWDVAQISSALHGYKDGSYGGTMKGLMKSQVSKLSDEDISAVATHISEL